MGDALFDVDSTPSEASSEKLTAVTCTKNGGWQAEGEGELERVRSQLFLIR